MPYRVCYVELSSQMTATDVETTDTQDKLEAIIGRMISSVAPEGGFVDPLYPNIIHGTEFSIVVKTREDSEIARHEINALNYWAQQNGMNWQQFGFRLAQVENRILAPYIGPEVYEVIDALNKRIQEEPENLSLITFRRAIILQQIDILARFTIDPYVPIDSKTGREIVSNPNIVQYYMQNMMHVLDNMRDSLFNPTLASNKTKSQQHLRNTLSVFKELVNENELERYVDTYQRNLCFLAPQRKPGTLGVDIDDILRLRSQFHREYDASNPGASEIEKDLKFLAGTLVQVDMHRNEKCALNGESLENIIRCPRLLDNNGFSAKEQENAFARYMLQVEYFRETAKNTTQNRQRVTALSAEIDKTLSGDYSLREGELIPFWNSKTKMHFLAMKLYKSLRWIGYIRDHYLGRYEHPEQEGCEPRVATYRWPLYTSDLEIHRTIVVSALREMLDESYAAFSEEDKTSKIIRIKTKNKEETYVLRKNQSTGNYEININPKKRALSNTIQVQSGNSGVIYDSFMRLKNKKGEEAVHLAQFLRLAYMYTLLQ